MVNFLKMLKYSRSCYLCDRKQLRKGKSKCGFHTFPVKIPIRTLWLNFCSLTESDNVKNVTICSYHFKPHDYIHFGAKDIGRQWSLKPGSVPSILHPKNGMTFSTIMSESGQMIGEENFNRRQLGTTLKTTRNLKMITNDISQNSTQEPEQTAIQEKCFTPKKLKFLQARYPSDIKSPHMSTPRKAKLRVKIAINKIVKQNRKIRTLQVAYRTLRKKVLFLKGLVKELKKKIVLPEDSADRLMEMVPQHTKVFINKTLTKKYFPEIRSFALSLQFYSTKAYNFVRRICKNLLPHPATVRKWYQVVNRQPGFTKKCIQHFIEKQKMVPLA